MPGHPSLDLRVLVRTMDDGAAWELDADLLDEDTFLAASLSEGTVDELSNVVEATWQQGSQDPHLPDRVLHRPTAGTCDLDVWDPSWALRPPPSNPLGGVRPGRQIILIDADSSIVLWAGIIETITTQTLPSDIGRTRITAVDPITAMEHAGVLPAAARTAEPVADRAEWVSATYLPDMPVVVDPGADSTVAATETGDTPWKTLVDAADAENGWLVITRDGTVVLLSNGNGEFISLWDGNWEHEDRLTGGRPLDGELRVDAAPGTGETVFTVTFHETPASGTFGTVLPGDTLLVALVETPQEHFRGTVDTVDTVGPHTTVVLTSLDGRHDWSGQPPRTTLVRVRSLDFAASPPGTIAWMQPDCGPASIIEATHDLAGLRNSWHVTRREAPEDTPPSVSEHPSTGSYGTWAFVWEDAPVPDVDGEIRLGAFGSALHGEPGPTLGALAVNLTAAQNHPTRHVLTRLLTTVEQSNRVLVNGPDGPVPATVAGWSWTWTGAGGLTGEIALGRSFGVSGTTRWFLGYVGASELDDTTILA